MRLRELLNVYFEVNGCCVDDDEECVEMVAKVRMHCSCISCDGVSIS